MSYMLLIVEPVGQRAERTEDEGRALYDDMMKFSADLKSRGLLVDSQSLKDVASATRVQVRNGKPTLTDGPFAEAKEMVGGYFLLSCNTREEALALAAECPAARWGTVEVRQFGPCYT